jgi:branched-chain amino acid transport system ATP-binding protein
MTATTGRETLLDMRGVTMRFGGVVAVDGLDLHVDQGEIFALIGPNGAGKTTAFNLITGVYNPTAGAITFGGKSIVGRKPSVVTRSGVARTFQNIRLFPNMTALENVLVGTDARHRQSVPEAIFGLPRHRAEERDGRKVALSLLDFVGIPAVAEETAKNLSYGDQRRLEIARALATEPRLLLLDEPAAGMNPAEKDGLQALVERIRANGRTVLLIEHDMQVVMGVSERITVLDHGQNIAEGTPEEVRANPRVVEAYLGKQGAAEAEAGAARRGESG